MTASVELKELNLLKSKIETLLSPANTTLLRESLLNFVNTLRKDKKYLGPTCTGCLMARFLRTQFCSDPLINVFPKKLVLYIGRNKITLQLPFHVIKLVALYDDYVDGGEIYVGSPREHKAISSIIADAIQFMPQEENPHV